MKKSFILLTVVSLLLLLLFSCETQLNNDCDNCACGIENPQKNIEWLANFIQKSETDTTGHYRGFIWLENYEGKDIFVVDMSLGSGGVRYYFYDCEGNPFVPKTFFNLKKHKLIYTNVSL